MFIFILAVYGLIFGSFINALVWRIFRQERPDLPDQERERLLKSKKLNSEPAILGKRSMCPNCRHLLAASDLVPVLSWILLRGKCRYCKKPISWQYPLVEFATALLFVISYLAWPYELNTFGTIRLAIWLLMLIGLITLIVYDAKWFELPDKIVWPLVAVAAGQTVWMTLEKGDFRILLSALIGAMILAGTFLLLYIVSRGRWIGFGDVKLAVALGLVVGSPLGAIGVLFGSSLIGTLATVPLLKKGRQGLKKQVPFGPFLIMATILIVLFGERILGWYMGLFW